ncbi:HNH endonuclease [Lachnospiraceae bacterium XBB2008]|nr:HNH endonuclease [Lachnospiraceae bacterium XBB2008]
MDQELHFEIVYENNLDTSKFARMFNNKAQSYKFYWFEAILNLTKDSDEDITFEEVIDEMICEAWHTVTHYHLRLGPTVNGNAENFLEHAINTLNIIEKELPQNPSKDELKIAIKKCDKELKKDKTRLTDYVPYKLLYPFFDVEGMEEGLEYIKNDKHSRLITYMAKLSGNENVFYTILDGVGLQKKIRINQYWRRFLIKNYSVIQSWVQYNKAQFLQDRNPGVPGIIYKICPENEELRKLEQARDLWRAVAEYTGKPIKEIYTGKDIPSDSLSLDHFVPRSYISNDELWNLTPMRKTLNSSKNNRLPLWDVFFEPFAEYQYYLYGLLFPESGEPRSPFLVSKFEKCKKNNLNAIWASEKLYVPGNTASQFTRILSHNLKPIYEAAQLQGYDTWKISADIT